MKLRDYFEKQGRGSLTYLAKQMGAKTSNVCLWAKGKKKVPTNHCPEIERITEGKVTCEELRPDVNWGVLRNSKGQ